VININKISIEEWACKPSPVDPRDFRFQLIAGIGTEENEIILKPTKIFNQSQYYPLGTCVCSSGIAGMKKYQEKENYPLEDFDLSVAHAYIECKKRDGISSQAGTYPRVLMQVLKDIGVCYESTLPYSTLTSDKNLNIAVPQKAYDEAKQFKINTYTKLSTHGEIQKSIACSRPVIGASLWSENMSYPEIENNEAFIPMPNGNYAGHAICIIGFSKNKKHTYKVAYKGRYTFTGFYLIQNSWGFEWGNKGIAWLPFAFLDEKVDGFYPYLFECWNSIDQIIFPPIAKKIKIMINKKEAIIDGREAMLDQAPLLIQDSNRTVLPVRIVEYFGYNVNWSNDGTIEIIKRI